MENKNDLPEFDLDDILNEFHDLPEEGQEAVDSQTLTEQDPELQKELQELDQLLDAPQTEVSETPEAPADVAEDTIRMDSLPEKEAEEEAAVSADETIRFEPVKEPEAREDESQSRVIELNPRLKLRELKKKLVAGPERRYYELTEMGLSSLQLAIFSAIVIVALCAAVTALFSLEIIPQSRLRFVIFSQVLAMLISALVGCHLMMDAVGELFRGKFTVNTLLVFTFLACISDAAFCLKELRIPCCAAFSLEMTLALFARYQKRSTEISQMDTLRKAVRLHSLTLAPDVHEGMPGILRGEGRLEDFWDNYQTPSGPEKLQNTYSLISLVCCLAIAAYGFVTKGLSFSLQVLSASLLVAVPAGFFVTITRPNAILEKRLHMVGTVLCGWQGVKALKGKAVFPVSDTDLFPTGSAKLNGVKFYGDRSPDDTVALSASLVCAAGGTLCGAFRQMNSGRGSKEYPVSNLRRYAEGGLGGEVCGEPVLLGSHSFLRDMGVEIPEGITVDQAIYSAIDGELCAVFAISYAKMRSAAGGLVTLCGNRKLRTVFTGTDFMLTESAVRSKFGIRTRRFQFPEADVRKSLAGRKALPDATAAVITTREELICFAYGVSGARSLRAAVRLGMAVNLLSGILGMLIMLALTHLGATQLLTPTHALLYQLVWLVPGILITEWTRII